MFLVEAFFSLSSSLPFSQGPRTARGVPAARIPGTNIPGKGKEGRKKGL